MSYKISFTRLPEYVHAVVSGENTRENVVRYLADIQHECIASNCSRVLIEERLNGPRLGILDVFRIASRKGLPSADKLPTIAYVDVNAEGSTMGFAEDVAVNRNINVRVFPSVTEAEEWLRGLAGADAGSNSSADTKHPRHL